jgi:hypothetical protein
LQIKTVLIYNTCIFNVHITDIYQGQTGIAWKISSHINILRVDATVQDLQRPICRFPTFEYEIS